MVSMAAYPLTMMTRKDPREREKKKTRREKRIRYELQLQRSIACDKWCHGLSEEVLRNETKVAILFLASKATLLPTPFSFVDHTSHRGKKGCVHVSKAKMRLCDALGKAVDVERAC